MNRITIRLKVKINSELDLRNLSQINFGQKIDQISKIKLLYNNRELSLGKLFNLKKQKINKKNNELIIFNINKYCNYLGWRWKRDILKINSDVGSFLGARMSGGEIYVNGSAMNYVGSEMINGKITIKSNSLDLVGSPLPGNKLGMSGGAIIIKGSARDYLGLNMRKGIIYVRGSCRNYCCNNMVAGTVIVKKSIGKYFGLGMKRGTVFADKISLKSKIFVESNELHETFFDLLYKFFLENYDLKIFRRKEKFRKFYGDKNIDGVGEILIRK